MPITRREFATLAAGGLSLVVLGQHAFGKDDDEKDKAHLATEPFQIGTIDQYKKAGLYQDYKESKGVWIVSDGTTLVVLSATCTHRGCTTRWVPDKNEFKCPCHGSIFGLDGINAPDMKAKRPLERCALSLIKESGNTAIVQVDPTHRFHQEKGEWTDPAASLPLA